MNRAAINSVLGQQHINHGSENFHACQLTPAERSCVILDAAGMPGAHCNRGEAEAFGSFFRNAGTVAVVLPVAKVAL